MNSKIYFVRIPNPDLNQAIEDYAAKHGIPLSTAIARMLAGGLKSLSGKPVNSFAVIDPQATVFKTAAIDHSATLPVGLTKRAPLPMSTPWQARGRAHCRLVILPQHFRNRAGASWRRRPIAGAKPAIAARPFYLP